MNGKVVRGYLGISIQDLNQDLAKTFGIKNSKRALVSDVKDDSPADQTGLKQGSPVEVTVGLKWLVTRTAVGMKVPVKVVRDGHEKYRTVTIGEQSDTTKVVKAEPNEKDYAFVGVIAQNLDRDLAEELGIKGKAQGVIVTSVEPDNGAE